MGDLILRSGAICYLTDAVSEIFTWVVLLTILLAWGLHALVLKRLPFLREMFWAGPCQGKAAPVSL